MADSEIDVNATDRNSSSVRETMLAFPELKPFLDYALIIGLVLIMLSMGCEMTGQTILAHLKRPIGISIGMASQFGIMPLCAYTLLRAINVSNVLATGVLIISCCPGGALSNLFSYYADGDVSLSVVMTFFSTLLATGMMPLNLWLYGRSFESKDVVIPYAKMALSLVFVTSPVALGMLIRWRFPKVATYATKIGSCVGFVSSIICIVLQLFIFSNMFGRIPVGLYACVLTLPAAGLALGFGLASVFRQDFPVRKTIAIECGVQNVATAFTVISLTFSPEIQADILMIPLLYGFAMCCVCSLCCVTYHAYKRFETESSKREDYTAMKPVVTNDLNT